ncbi:alpha/beta fold hydrolase [Actinacidiphila sp. ITFR-21]|uniref:alpha/beta fold hydrolase n=1 Tax=Actinacidiphila sp. ITFR-21 TaxID=3075199 RepID=UPI002889175B|nr:alpha/beta fold hydrolase [Streptomyces sp. ITFR-21]WNI16458.1 alpha/beta fold hydrolase [Streptomyces sp. ITFR-21]
MSIWTRLSNGPFAVEFVDAGGVRTRSLRVGDGGAREVVVLLHGTSSHLEVWAGNVRAYADAGLAAHAIDMLGHGFTDTADHDCEVPHYVRHLLDYLDARGLDRVHLVGESLGGWVTAWFAAAYPERVRSLQLVASGGTRAVPAVMRRIRETTTLAVTSPERRYTRDRLANLLHDPASVDEELVDVRYAIYHQPAFQKNLPHLLCMQDPDVRARNLLTPERMARISAPTLVFWGRHNPMGDVSEAVGIHAAIPDAGLQVFDDCGHFPQIEYPDRFNELSVEFIRQTAAKEKRT